MRLKNKVQVAVPVVTMTVKLANEITGGLSRPSKMPGRAYGIPASMCKRGKKLANIQGSVCAHCYALKGRYGFDNVQQAQARRFKQLRHPQWVDAMVVLIGRQKEPYFRWFDSGDLQGAWHLKKIVQVCERLPEVNFWLPTREQAVLKTWKGALPDNLTVRLSGAMVDGSRPSGYPTTSTVVSKDKATSWKAQVARNNKGQHFCPAPLQKGECGDCRACWSGAVKNTTYLLH